MIFKLIFLFSSSTHSSLSCPVIVLGAKDERESGMSLAKENLGRYFRYCLQSLSHHYTGLDTSRLTAVSPLESHLILLLLCLSLFLSFSLLSLLFYISLSRFFLHFSIFSLPRDLFCCSWIRSY